MGKTIAVVSGKGGVGKSTITAYLALYLGRRGHTVCVLDGDNGMRSLDILLKVENKVVYDLSDVAEEICPLKRALVKTDYDNVSLLSANASSDAVTLSDMRRIVEKMKQSFDYVLIDAPAGTGAGFRNAVAGAETVIAVTTADAVAVRDAERVTGLLKKQGIADIRLILNRQTRRIEKAKGPLAPDEIAHRVDISLLGRIPDDRKIVSDDAPSVKGAAAKALERIAARLDGEAVPIPDRVAPLFG